MSSSTRQIAFATVSSFEYLAGALLLAESLSEHCPGSRLHIYLIEKKVETLVDLVLPKNCTLVLLEEVGIPGLRAFSFQYDAMALCCALKSRIIADVLDRVPCQFAAYIDNDMMLFGDLVASLQVYFDEAGTSVWLTPHLKEDLMPPDGAAILRSGIFNGGFFAVRNDENARRFLRWWASFTERECISDPMRGIVFDQKWLDLSVTCFPFVGVIRHRGINVGHWDLHEKQFSGAKGTVSVGAEISLVLYHFSGAGVDVISRYLLIEEDAIVGGELLREIVSDYCSRRAAVSKTLSAAVDYSFDHFNNGDAITPGMREVVRMKLIDVDDPFDQPEEVSKAAQAFATTITAANITNAASKGVEAVHLINRLYRHWLIGRVWKLVIRLINKSLRPDSIIDDKR